MYIYLYAFELLSNRNITFKNLQEKIQGPKNMSKDSIQVGSAGLSHSLADSSFREGTQSSQNLLLNISLS